MTLSEELSALSAWRSRFREQPKIEKVSIQFKNGLEVTELSIWTLSARSQVILYHSVSRFMVEN